ncbi:omptin family outer membrane protease [Chitinophaga dinghuensis]|nr:omptin family outer membrane protease [Chitinophaga dinghuensis]
MLCAQDSSQVVAVDLAGGYQVTNLRWSIAGRTNERAINVLSEVKWQGLTGPLVSGKIRLEPIKRIFVGGEVSKCFIKTGNATDTDYGENDRQLPTYHAQLDSDEGTTTAFQVFGGYTFLQRKRVKIAAFAGYGENTAFLFLFNRATEVAGQKNLRCTYNATWKGLLGGLTGIYKPTYWWCINGELSYCQMNYNAVADWNLIDAFQHPVSFKQRAKGFAVRLSLSSAFRLNRHLSLFIAGAYQQAETGTGTDELFLESGVVQISQFNGILTHGGNLALGTRFQF